MRMSFQRTFNASFRLDQVFGFTKAQRNTEGYDPSNVFTGFCVGKGKHDPVVDATVKLLRGKSKHIQPAAQVKTCGLFYLIGPPVKELVPHRKKTEPNNYCRRFMKTLNELKMGYDEMELVDQGVQEEDVLNSEGVQENKYANSKGVEVEERIVRHYALLRATKNAMSVFVATLNYISYLGEDCSLVPVAVTKQVKTLARATCSFKFAGELVEFKPLADDLTDVPELPWPPVPPTKPVPDDTSVPDDTPVTEDTPETSGAHQSLPESYALRLWPGSGVWFVPNRPWE
eukprot:GHVO01034689.1.p1 GENE.GHVO01034689.1~~GHVO01034689.1.p1  ORF type:complete len:287 (+),score=24.07 GHVO01034689.1:19-879(+)